VVVLKSGKHLNRNPSCFSHSATLAGDYEIFSSVLSQHGVVEAKDEFELIPFVKPCVCYRRSIEGNMGIITGSGGHGALAVDACLSHGLSVPTLKDEDQIESKRRSLHAFRPLPP